MEKLQFINEQMEAISVPYEFGEWTSKVTYPYFVGEISEEPPTSEDGAEESTLILTGWNRGSYIALEDIKAKIKKHFNPICGLMGETESGAIIVFYDGAFNIPTGEESSLKKMQINLKIKEWKGA